MQNVFHNTDDIAVIGPEWIEQLKQIAMASPMKRARVCLHRSDDDQVHEMIIALARDCLFQPHRHPFKSESFHMIFGRLIVVLFKNDGTPMRSLLLSPPGQGGVICYRLCVPTFHAVFPLDEVVVFHEVTNGPFVKNDAVLANWAPQSQDELRLFLVKAALDGGLPPEVRRELERSSSF